MYYLTVDITIEFLIAETDITWYSFIQLDYRTKIVCL